MKRKLLLALTLVAIFAFVFALSVSAEILEWTETKDLGFAPKTTTDGTVTFDTTSRVMLKHTVIDEETQEETTVYTTYPSYYILKCTDTVFSSKKSELDFTAINQATGISYTEDSIYKFEMPVGFTSMQDRNFRVNDGIDKAVYVKIAEGVTSVGVFQCYQNTVIEEIIFPDTITDIDTDRLFFGATKLTTVKLPSNLDTIVSQCFSGCTSLTTVLGTENVASFGELCFYNCSSLTSITIGNGATTLGKSAFYGCSSLKTVSIPSSVTSVGTTVFNGCSSLETVYYAAPIVGTYMFDACKALTTVYFDSSVVEIGERAFRQCTALSSVTFSEGLTTIGASAFYGAGLTSVDTPASLTSISASVFEQCASITSVRIRGTVVGEKMFNNCTKITSISFPMLTSVGANAFYSTALKQNGVGTGRFFLVENDYESLITTATATSGNANFSAAVPCTYDEYVAYVTNGTVPTGKTFNNKCLLVYGCPYCETLYDGHDFAEEIVPTFDGDKFVSTCTLGQLCTREQCKKQVPVSSLDPLFTFAGFSKAEYNGSVMQSFSVNRALISSYESIFGELSFGLLAGVEKADSTNEEVQGQFGGVLYDNEAGTFKNKVASVDFSKRSYDVFEMKITGLDNYQNASVYCCAYVIEDGKILYLHNGTSTELATAFVYSSIS